ncbi:MAG TPA: hypothetical protein VMW65_18650 [Chloroflexota bacterium]|nr:hypothetical protein [Chloroflexota bacterium]
MKNLPTNLSLAHPHAWLFAVALVVAALWPAGALADGTVIVTPSTVVAGRSVSVHGSGWAPNDQILVSFTDPNGDVVPLGVVLADAAGQFTQVVPVPATVPPGFYKIDGNGQGGAVAVTIEVVAPTPIPRPPTSTLGLPSTTATASQAAEGSISSPTPSPTLTDTPTPKPTQTPIATSTPTNTSTPTETATLTPTPTNTPSIPERILQSGGTASARALIAIVPIAATIGFVVGRRTR